MKEKIAKILSEYAIHCNIEKNAWRLLIMLHSYGYVWDSGHSLLAFSCWKCYAGNTYYRADGYSLTYGTIAINPEKEIITFDEFKERLNMEKEIKIKVPEGYEIDKENSTFECIKFKPIKKVETYDDVARELFYSKETYYICSHGEVKHLIGNKGSFNESNNCVTRKQAEKLLAINKLMNVAFYLNKDWKPDWGNANQRKYYLVMIGNTLSTTYSWTIPCGTVAFMNEETALRTKEILGEDTIKLALGDY